MKLSEAVCQQARILIANRLGLDFPDNRQADLVWRLGQAVQTSSVSTPEAYLARLVDLPDGDPEWLRLAESLTVGETYFFRDRATFAAFEQQILPALITTRRAAGCPWLRLWSAGCATGEEPYSLAILLDRLLPDRTNWTLTLLATDLNRNALETAQRGLYRERALRETPAWIRERYFYRRSEHVFEIDPGLRQMVTFMPLNLVAEDHPSVVSNIGAMDVIFCRNVLMYFTPEAQRATIARLQRVLASGGWLVVSPAEMSTALFQSCVAVQFPGAILYRQAATVATPTPPLALPGVDLHDTWNNAPFVPPGDAPVAPALSRTPQEQGCPSRSAPATDLQHARTLADQGQLDAARRLCKAVLRKDRLTMEAYLLLATICQEQGEIPAALEALRRAIYVVPDSPLAYFLLGSLLLQQGQRQQGKRSMETVVTLLYSVPRHAVVAGGDGITAGQLLETARMYLEWQA
jgi:chemotaxis protein methyltransferase CheR